MYGVPGSPTSSGRWLISTERTNPRRRRRLPIIAAVVFTVLAGAMAGASAQNPTGEPSGFLLDRGRYSTITAPNTGMAISPIGINERSQIVGSFADDGGMTHGFFLDRRGRFVSIDVPGSTGTQAEKINNRGQIVGVYVDIPNPAPDAPRRGFLLDRGRFTRLDAPDAVATLAHGINDRGQVVGEYKDAAGKTRGFLWDKGRFATFDGPDGTGAAFTEINDRGQIVGVYGEFGGPAQRGFLLSGAVYSTFNAPDAVGTFPAGINNRDQIVGTRVDDVAGTRGQGFLLAQGARGPFTPVAFPGASVTTAFGINDRGQIVGVYANTAAPNGKRSTMRMPMLMSRR